MFGTLHQFEDVNQQATDRRQAGSAPGGLTILEVLFSMGIIAVGLLGVLTILPVAGMRTTRGMIADAADRLGRNAIRQVDVRSMRHPEMWTRFDTMAQAYREYPTVPPPPLSPPALVARRSRSFCIDPLFIATHVNAGAARDVTEYFPYYALDNVDTETRMQRISLRPFPNATTGLGMSLAAAMEIFSSQDDLVFEVPEDPMAMPLQNFSEDATRRQAMGRLSWLATLTPKQHFQAPETGTIQYSDLYILSIVVFHGRNLTLEVANAPNTDWEITMSDGDWPSYGPANERVLNVEAFDGAGYAGGDVLLQSRDGRPVQDLAIRTGDWVMLSTRISTTDQPVHFFRWYRVVAADSGVDGTGTGPWTRNVTLHGSDWDIFVAARAGNPALRTQATVLSNVVAVYEKTVRLENSSLWAVE